MKDFLSHGPGSSLLEHTREVMLCARTLPEKITAACHDIGKATAEWQTYIRTPNASSPHPHAAAGGILSCCILFRMGMPEEGLAALHSAAAHHAYLAPVDVDDRWGLEKITGSTDVRDFFLDRRSGIAFLLPEITEDILTKAWEDFCIFKPFDFIGRPEWAQLNNSGSRFDLYLQIRFFLGRLCFTDQMSAKKQSGNKEGLQSWEDSFAPERFCHRHERSYSAKSTLSELRNKLRNAFLETVRKEAVFHFIDAPTGLGKTEAMLQAAESLREKYNLDKIVYAVPQVSIADQIYDEYFDDSDSAGIWNYLRKDSTGKHDNAAGSDSDSLTVEANPFAKSYNVTTFNQVLLAMCHPNRMRCIRSLALRNAVIIFDEFHKLPMPVMPLFFRLARKYAEMFSCRFIVGSATPLEKLPYWDLSDMNCIDSGLTASVYRDPLIDQRRTYHFIGQLSLELLTERISRFHEDNPSRNLLVVVNLVGKASWPLRRTFCQGYFPWRDLESLSDPSPERKVVILDGLVPPAIRRQLVRACKERMKRCPGGLTLISTQMIEVGVDLDFDAAIIDYQGLASVIQRGGRVGREGRTKPCQVEVFSLLLEDKTSFEILNGISNDENSVLKQAMKLEQSFREKEKCCFERLSEQPADPLTDSTLAGKLAEIQKRVFGSVNAEKSVRKMEDFFFRLNLTDGSRIGADFDNAQYIAELFDAEYGTPILVLENAAEAAALFGLQAKILHNESDRSERDLFFKKIARSRITLSRGISPEDDLMLQKYGDLEQPEVLPVYFADVQNVW